MDFRLRLSTTARFSTPSKRCQGRRSIDVLKRPTAGFEPVMVCLPPPLLRWLALHRHHQRPAQAAEGPRDWKSVSIHPQQTSGQARLSGAAGGKVRRPQTGGGDQAAHPTGQTSADRDCPGTLLTALPQPAPVGPPNSPADLLRFQPADDAAVGLRITPEGPLAIPIGDVATGLETLSGDL